MTLYAMFMRDGALEITLPVPVLAEPQSSAIGLYPTTDQAGDEARESNSTGEVWPKGAPADSRGGQNFWDNLVRDGDWQGLLDASINDSRDIEE